MSLISALIKTYKGNKLSRNKLEKLQNKRLQKLVKFARNNSPYFKNLYARVDEKFKLQDLPVTNKIDMMQNFDNWLTDSNVTLDKIEDFMLNTDNVGRMINGKYLVFKTSGSTGNPAVILYDKSNIDVASAVAALRTFARKEDFKSFMKNGKRTAGVFANNGFYLACGMSRYLQLLMPKKKNKITIDVNSATDEIVKLLNNFNPSMLSGYPSNLSLLLDNHNLNIKPDVIISGGEMLTDEVRTKLSDRFNCYVQTHYSCTEAGEIACECSEKRLHINEDWVIVEPVDKDNKPVGFGEMSDKVLITNLSNYIQPIIRYVLTDRVIMHKEKCKCGKNTYWLEVEGRSDDVLMFENNISVAPMSFYKILSEIKGIKRFQLVQQSVNNLELRIDSDNSKEAFVKAKTELQNYLMSLNIKKVAITLSKDLPQTNKLSGKFNHIIKNF